MFASSTEKPALASIAAVVAETQATSTSVIGLALDFLACAAVLVFVGWLSMRYKQSYVAAADSSVRCEDNSTLDAEYLYRVQ